MSPATARSRACGGGRSHRSSGAALVIGLLLLTVMTVLAISAVATASLELQMTGNEQYQEQAFRAAESGIAQAIAAGVFTTDPAAIAALYAAPASSEPTPRRGLGTPIAGCADPPGTTSGPCEYFLRFDHATGPTAVPGAPPSSEGELRAYHFVIDSFGVAARGAVSHQVQGFYLVGVSQDALTGPPVRTDWRQRGVDTE